MNTRTRALEWLASRGIKPKGHVVTSKRYAPDESWTKSRAWWIQIPAEPIREGKEVHILCEAASKSSTFRYLIVPAAVFQDHLEEFATIGDNKINLFLSADEGLEFADQRGPGRVSLAQFERE